MSFFKNYHRIRWSPTANEQQKLSHTGALLKLVSIVTLDQLSNGLNTGINENSGLKMRTSSENWYFNSSNY